MTRKKQVLERLRQAAGDWVNGPELANETVGGSEGHRRLRELRAEGYAIEERKHPDPNRSIWQYRMVGIGPRVPVEAPPAPIQPLRPGAEPTPLGKYRCPVRDKNGVTCNRELGNIEPYGIAEDYVRGRCYSHHKVLVKA
jgi:hypothetical protein